MNEQNNNVLGSNTTPNTPMPNPNPVESPSVMENINTIQPGVVPSTNGTPAVTPTATPQSTQAPVQQLGQQVAVTPTPTPQPTQVTPTVVQANTSTPTPVAPVQPAQVPAPTPSVIPQTNSVAPTPTPVVTQQEPASQEQLPQYNPNPTEGNGGITNASNGVYGPSKPMSSDADLTNVGFVAASESLPKKKSKLPLILALIILVVLGIVGYFVVYPYVLKTFFNDPKNVYSATIDGAFKSLNTTINEVAHDKAIYDIELSFDSNLEAVKPYSGYKYGVNFGIDPNKKNLQLGYSIKTPANIEYSAYSYIKDNKNYERYSTYMDANGKIGLIYTGEADTEQVNDLFSSFKELIDNYSNVNNEDLTYLTNKVAEILINSIDESKLSKEDASITLNGDTLKVTNNKYVLDLDNKRRTVKYVLDELKKDDKAMEIIAKMTEISKEEIIKALDINVDELITDDDTLYISIYTYGNKNSIVGYALTDEKEEIELYYHSKDENYFEAYLYTVNENDLTGKREEDKLSIKGVNNADGHKITITSNDEEIAVLDVKTWEKDNIEFDYTIKDENGDLTGTIKYNKDVNDDRLKLNFEFSIRVSKEENLSISLSLLEDWSSEVANINTSATGNVVTLDEAQLAEVRNKFNTELMNNTPLGTLFQTVSGLYSPDIEDYYNPIELPAENGDITVDNNTGI